MRGAERTFLEMARLFPAAPIYTTIYSESGTEGAFAGREIHTSPLQRLGVGQGGFRALLPLFPPATARLRPRGCDLLLTSSSAFAIRMRPDPGVPHVCYCHTPFRYAHHERKRALREVRAPLRPALGATLAAIRRGDVEAGRRVDLLIANSETTRRRIAAAYGREAPVVHPPVDVARFGATPGRGEGDGRGEYFLCVTELVPHKGVEIALEAARLSGSRLVVAGSGPAEPDLRARFGDVGDFRGRVSDGELEGLYRGARAVVVPTVEEFGIVAVEAQAAGRPVIAPREGGAAETVRAGETGVLLDARTAAAFAEAMADCDWGGFEPEAARRSAARFSPEIFRLRLASILDEPV
jgi:glycosyltransferase involved in cell wall biosynthesis